MFFNPPAKCIVDVAFSMVQLFDTHFGQVVFGIVLVVLSATGGLFAQVLIAFFFTTSSVQLVSRSIVLQRILVGLITVTYDAIGDVVAVITLSLTIVFFAYLIVPVVAGYR